MLSRRYTQIIVILLACGLVGFLFFNGRNHTTVLKQSPKASEKGEALTPSSSFNFALLEKDKQKKLSAADRQRVKALHQKSNDSSYSQLAALYVRNHQPALAGFYYHKLATEHPKNKMWQMKTGASFFDAEQTVNDSGTFAYFINLSMAAFDKVLAQDPQNLEALTDQAINYKEGKGEVMKGVGMLRTALQIDSNYRKAIFYLGLLSIESQQIEKAEQRFEKLTSLPIEPGDENYPYYWRYLGEVKMMLGKKEEAHTAFLKYKNLVDMLTSDPKMQADAAQLVKSAE